MGVTAIAAQAMAVTFKRMQSRMAVFRVQFSGIYFEIAQYSSPQNGTYAEKHIFRQGEHLDAPQFCIRIALSELLPPQ